MNASDKSAVAVRDPVCGMTVNPATAKHTAEHYGTTYYFCCSHCGEKFRSDPAKYLKPATPVQLVMLGASSHESAAPAAVKAAPAGASTTRLLPAPAPAGATYVCPMC